MPEQGQQEQLHPTTIKPAHWNVFRREGVLMANLLVNFEEFPEGWGEYEARRWMKEFVNGGSITVGYEQ